MSSILLLSVEEQKKCTESRNIEEKSVGFDHWMWGGKKTKNQGSLLVFWLGQVEGPWNCSWDGDAESERERGEFIWDPLILRLL